MAERSKGFVLTPSRLGKPPNTEETATAKPVFTGLKQSKLGLLAESKFNFGATPSRPEGEEKKETELIRPATFSFTPLTKKSDDAENTGSILFSKKPTDPGNEKSISSESELPKPIFGENLLAKVVVPPSDSVPIFGQNLAEKAIIPPSVSTDTTQSENLKSDVKASELLFSAAVAAAPLPPEEEKKTLSESAAEYTESHAVKRKYDEVTVVTGEEEESNVLQANVKLYLFDSEKRNWTERGRGLLRLNDAPNSSPGHLKSRLVMRTTGSLRVVLNTKLWPEMICEKVNEKNIRISATDNDHVSIFLIAASQKDTEKLFTALEHRISQLKQDKEEEGGGEEEQEEGGGEEEQEDEEDEEEEDEGEPAAKRPVPEDG